MKFRLLFFFFSFKNRQRLLGAWNRAVRFLSGNESRIRVESQRIAGEDFEVWRWIQVATPKAHSPKSARLVSIHTYHPWWFIRIILDDSYISLYCVKANILSFTTGTNPLSCEYQEECAVPLATRTSQEEIDSCYDYLPRKQLYEFLVCLTETVGLASSLTQDLSIFVSFLTGYILSLL